MYNIHPQKTGLEFRESAYVIGPKNARELFKGMSINLAIGFSDLENSEASDKKSKTYALLLSDIVVVGESGASVVTSASKEFSDISFFFKVGVDGGGDIGLGLELEPFAGRIRCGSGNRQ